MCAAKRGGGESSRPLQTDPESLSRPAQRKPAEKQKYVRTFCDSSFQVQEARRNQLETELTALRQQKVSLAGKRVFAMAFENEVREGIEEGTRSSDHRVVEIQAKFGTCVERSGAAPRRGTNTVCGYLS